MTQPYLRRIKLSSSPLHYYNAQRIPENPPMTATRINFSLLNIQGLITQTGRNKSKFISDLTTNINSQHMIAITETFLTDAHLDAEILKSFPEYNINRADRDLTVGRKHKQGGCLLLTSPNILSNKVKSFSNGACEVLITEHSLIELSVITLYRPPDTTTTEFEVILHIIDQYLSNHKSANNILTGDFNFPPTVVNWITGKHGIFPSPTNCRDAAEKIQLQQLLELTDKYYLQQIINVPTRIANTLDLLFTDTPNQFYNLQSICITGVSDHNLLPSKQNSPRKSIQKKHTTKVIIQKYIHIISKEQTKTI